MRPDSEGRLSEKWVLGAPLLLLLPLLLQYCSTAVLHVGWSPAVATKLSAQPLGSSGTLTCASLCRRSTDPRGAGERLSDLGGELAGGLGLLLPVVEEDAEFHGDAELGAGASRCKRQRLVSWQEWQLITAASHNLLTASLLAPQQGTAGTDNGDGVGAAGGSGTFGTLSQFQLLEESGPGTQALLGPTDAMSHSTLALIGWVAVGRGDSFCDQRDAPTPSNMQGCLLCDMLQAGWRALM